MIKYPSWVASTDPEIKKGYLIFKSLDMFERELEVPNSIELNSFDDYLILKNLIDRLCYQAKQDRTREIIGNIELNIGKLIG